MEEKEILTANSLPPANILNEQRLNRFGNIFTKMAITSAILMLLALLSTMITPILFVCVILVLFTAVILMVVCTFGAVFAIESKPVEKVWSLLKNVLNSGDSMERILVFCMELSKWIAIAGAVASAIAIVFVAVSKATRKTSKIIWLSIGIVLFVLYFIINIITGGFHA